jgi:hypothetical protein
LLVFIEELYFKRFGKHRPDTILPIEELFSRKADKKAAKRRAKLERKPATTGSAPATPNEIIPLRRESPDPEHRKAGTVSACNRFSASPDE